jgi:hypothetical protein
MMASPIWTLLIVLLIALASMVILLQVLEEYRQRAGSGPQIVEASSIGSVDEQEFESQGIHNVCERCFI